MKNLFITLSPMGERNIVMSVSVCLCVCLCVCVFVCPRSYLQNYTSNLQQFFVLVTCGHGLALLWQRSDMLRISGFMDDIIFAHKLRLVDVAARLRQSGSRAALSLTRGDTRCRHWMHGTTSCSQCLPGCR